MSSEMKVMADHMERMFALMSRGERLREKEEKKKRPESSNRRTHSRERSISVVTVEKNGTKKTAVKLSDSQDLEGKEGLVTFMRSQSGRKLAIKLFKNVKKSEAAFRNEVAFQQRAAELGVAPKICKTGRDTTGRLYIVMDAMKETLSSVMEKACRGDTRALKKMKTAESQLIQIMEQLDSVGILHNDSKSNNFMFGSKGKLYAIDFGMSKKIARGGMTNLSPEMIGVRVLSLTRGIRCGDREQTARRFFPVHARKGMR